jgi:polyhydroxyalkanoate synthesis regulator phasin
MRTPASKKTIKEDISANANPNLTEFEKQIQKLSNEELKDLLLINTYKLTMTRAQLEAVIEILIKNKILTYEEVWKRTNEIFKDNR